MKKSGKICCLVKDCNTCPSYNYPSETKGIYCGKHKKEEMINVVSNTCLEKDCRIQPCHNYPSETKGIYCGKHKEKGMVDVKNELCKEKDCIAQPSYNYPSETKRLFCFEHRKEGMVGITKKRCLEKNCIKYPCFNFPSEVKSIYCNSHKKEGMVNITSINKICLKEGCETRSHFNYPSETKSIYCGKHKKKGMINVVSNTCLEEDCTIRPCYNYPSETKRLYCKKHMKEGMIDVVSNTCLEEDCTTRPSFNFPSETKGIYCRKHKEEGMVDITKKRCLEEGCEIIPHFNNPSETKGIYCTTHKKEGMICVTVKSCSIKDCNSRVLYGFSGYPLTKCAKHKESGMIAHCTRNCKGFNKIDGKSTKCTYKATHGIISSIPEFCEVHAPKEYFALTNRVCKGCKTIDVLTDKGLCFFCDPKIFKKRRLAKQRKVQDWLDASHYNKNYEFTDKTFPEDYECFKRRRRPDFLYDCGTHFVILEVDENQHNHEGYSCEAKRMGELAQALGLPTIFIRYNPDEYKGPKGRKLYSTDAKRKKILLNQLSRCKMERIENFNKQFVRVLYLYYDGFDESLTPELETLDIEKLI